MTLPAVLLLRCQTIHSSEEAKLDNSRSFRIDITELGQCIVDGQQLPRDRARAAHRRHDDPHYMVLGTFEQEPAALDNALTRYLEGSTEVFAYAQFRAGERIEPEHLFSFRWHPNAVDPNTDYSNEPTTLVEFRLEARDVLGNRWPQAFLAAFTNQAIVYLLLTLSLRAVGVDFSFAPVLDVDVGVSEVIGDRAFVVPNIGWALFERAWSLRGMENVLLEIALDPGYIGELLDRIGDGGVAEIVVATNPNVEGETTALYVARMLKPLGVRVTRIASGLPVGGDLEYADEVTLGRALEARREM